MDSDDVAAWHQFTTTSDDHVLLERAAASTTPVGASSISLATALELQRMRQEQPSQLFAITMRQCDWHAASGVGSILESRESHSYCILL